MTGGWEPGALVGAPVRRNQLIPLFPVILCPLSPGYVFEDGCPLHLANLVKVLRDHDGVKFG